MVSCIEGTTQKRVSYVVDQAIEHKNAGYLHSLRNIKQTRFFLLCYVCSSEGENSSVDCKAAEFQLCMLLTNTNGIHLRVGRVMPV